MQSLDLSPEWASYRTKLAGRYGTTSIRNQVLRLRVMVKYLIDHGMVERMRFGSYFNPPSKKQMRAVQNAKQVFEPGELRETIQAAPPQLRPAILLGINCGFNNMDFCSIEVADIYPGRIEMARTKTEVPRTCPLWPETEAAIAAVVRESGTALRNTKGNPWNSDALSAEFRKLTRRIGVYREKLSFSSLRYTFETVAGDTGDQVAVNAIMGHVDPHISANYRHGVAMDRLQAAIDAVKAWLGI